MYINIYKARIFEETYRHLLAINKMSMLPEDHFPGARMQMIPGDWFQLGIFRAMGYHDDAQSLLKTLDGVSKTRFNSTVVSRMAEATISRVFTHYEMHWQARNPPGEKPIPDKGPCKSGIDIRWNTDEKSVEELRRNVLGTVNGITSTMRQIAFNMRRQGMISDMYERTRIYPHFTNVKQFVFVKSEEDKCFIVEMNYGVDPEVHANKGIREERENSIITEDPDDNFEHGVVAEEEGNEENEGYNEDYGEDCCCSDDLDSGCNTPYEDDYEDWKYEFSNQDDLFAYVRISFEPQEGLSGLHFFLTRHFGQKEDPKENLLWNTRRILPGPQTNIESKDFVKIISEKAVDAAKAAKSAKEAAEDQEAQDANAYYASLYSSSCACCGKRILANKMC